MPEIEQSGKFWAVWDAEDGFYDLVDSKFKPVDTEDAVHKAMEKLALLHPERKLYLLAAVWSCEAATSVEWEAL